LRIEFCPLKTFLTDWKPLRALHTSYNSDDCSTVKEVKIGQSAAKYLYFGTDKGSTTIPSGSTGEKKHSLGNGKSCETKVLNNRIHPLYDNLHENLFDL
jgi:hypothetical protein